VAFTRKAPGAVEVVLLSLRDGSQRLLASHAGDEAALAVEGWSPGGDYLMVLEGTGTYLTYYDAPDQPRTLRWSATWQQHLVYDTAGRLVWEHPVCTQLCALLRVLWAGPDQLFVGTGGAYSATGGDRRSEGYFVNLPSGSRSGPLAFDGYIRCFSPGGRYAYWEDRDGNDVIWDLSQNEMLMRARTGGYTGSCDWTQDETRVVLSSGGF
jgi:hypothetical protein